MKKRSKIGKMNDIQERFLILSVKRPFCNTGFLKNIDEFWRGVLGTMLFFLQSMLFCCSADFLVTEISAKDQQPILGTSDLIASKALKNGIIEIIRKNGRCKG